MKRNITQKEYQKTKENNQDCLNWNKMQSLPIVKEWAYWVIIRPTNGCEYKEYNGHKVKSHYLIVPKEDHGDLSDMARPEIAEWNHIIFDLTKKFAKRKCIINWKTKAFRSIDKFHGHVIIMV